MPGDDDDLFADSDDDTAELMQKSKKAAPPKKKAPAAKASNDDLFDSDDDDDDAPKSKLSKAEAKRQRMAALVKKKRDDSGTGGGDADDGKRSSKSASAARKKAQSGYESEDSQDSAAFQRTAEDDAFIDTTGEDDDAIAELYAAQHFDDRDEAGVEKKSKSGSSKKRSRDYDDSDRPDAVSTKDLDNPIIAAVHKMKKKKREKKSFTEIEDEITIFLKEMNQAAEADERAVAEKRPALAKLQFVNTAVDMLTRQDMQRPLLDMDVLVVVKRWIQPLPSGSLGNLTVRQKLLHAVAHMTGETGITAQDLKRSELGRVIMILFKHPQETPALRKQAKLLIEQWSRPIFQKSGNMRDLERVQRPQGSLHHFRQQQQQEEAPMARGRMSGGARGRAGGGGAADLQTLIASGKRVGEEKSGAKRVSVPFSRGFAYSVRPMAKTATDSPAGNAAAAEHRNKLSKRMLEKSRTVSKNQRSANISVEGRRTKG